MDIRKNKYFRAHHAMIHFKSPVLKVYDTNIYLYTLVN